MWLELVVRVVRAVWSGLVVRVAWTVRLGLVGLDLGLVGGAASIRWTSLGVR